jgi:beta-lactamase class A
MRLAVVASAAALAVLVVPLGAVSAGRSPVDLARLLAEADRLSGSVDPTRVQARYEIARSVEGELWENVPTAKCRAVYRALRAAARAHVTASEGVDRLLPSLRVREQESLIARRRLAAALPSCPSGHWRRKAGGPRPLLEPLDGEAFFGVVRAKAPAAATRVEVAWNTRVVARRLAKAQTTILLTRVRPGPGSLKMQFFNAAGSLLSTRHARRVWLLPTNGQVPSARTRTDRALSARLAVFASGFSGYSGIWVQDLRTGRSASWNAEARFPAASTVKLGVLIAALDRFGPRPERSPFAYDLETLTAWSSNLAANRLFGLLGRGTVEQRLRRMGATRSTYPREYRVGTSVRRRTPGEPPQVSDRTTTAHDLAALLTGLQAAAAGDPSAMRRAGLSRHEARVGLAMLLRSLPVGDNAGLFRRWLPKDAPAAQKHGWISSARHSAAIVYTVRGPVVVVLLTFREPSIVLSDAQLLARLVLTAAAVSLGG